MPRTIDDVISGLRGPPGRPLAPGPYDSQFTRGPRIMLAVESMRRHSTDEGWQVAAGLAGSGYALCGHDLPVPLVSVPEIVRQLHPSTIVIQDKREWDVHHGDFRDPQAAFIDIAHLAGNQKIFKVTILKDAHQNPEYHMHSAYEIGCHAWIIYYHPKIVKHLAPYVRTEHLIRTHHSIDSSMVPSPCSFAGRTQGALLSGAISRPYPLRRRMLSMGANIESIDVLPHPGYHANCCNTPTFMHLLAQYKVSLCEFPIFASRGNLG